MIAEKSPAHPILPTTNSQNYSRVVLTLHNLCIPEERLRSTPSMEDGLDREIETDLRNFGCELIQTAGILLKLPQVAMATGQLLFQRYYYSRSFVRHSFEITAIACVHLASKIEEAPRRIRDCMNVFHHMKQVRLGKTISPMILDSNYISIKSEVIKAERRVLKELGFCVHVKHPHKTIMTILQQIDQKENTRLANLAWNYMNDSFRTDVFVRFPPAAIACSCVFLAARQLGIPLPNDPPWYAIFSATNEQVESVALTILTNYSRPKVQPERLDAAIAEAKRQRVEAMVKDRNLAQDDATDSPALRAAGTGNASAQQSPHDLTVLAGAPAQIQPESAAASEVAAAAAAAAAVMAARAGIKPSNNKDGDTKPPRKGRSRSPHSRSRSRHDRGRDRHKRHSSSKSSASDEDASRSTDRVKNGSAGSSPASPKHSKAKNRDKDDKRKHGDERRRSPDRGQRRHSRHRSHDRHRSRSRDRQYRHSHRQKSRSPSTVKDNGDRNNGGGSRNHGGGGDAGRHRSSQQKRPENDSRPRSPKSSVSGRHATVDQDSAVPVGGSRR